MKGIAPPLFTAAFPLVRGLLADIARRHRAALIGLAIIIFIVSVINAALPYVLGRIAGFLTHLGQVQHWLVMLIALFVCKVGLQYFLSARTHFLSQTFAFRLRELIIARTIHARPGLVESFKQGEVYHTVFVELGALQSQAVFGTLYAVKNALFIVLLALSLLRLSPLLFLDLIAFLAIWNLCIRLIGGRLERVNGLWQRHNASFLAYFSELLSGKSDVFIFKLEARVVAQVARITAQLKRLSAVQAAYTGAHASLTELLLGAYLLSVVTIILQSHISPADTVTALGYLFMLLGPARELNEYFTSFFSLRPALARTEAYLAKLLVSAPTPHAAAPEINSLGSHLSLAATNLSFSYPGSLTPSVTHFSYTFTPGLALITGRNGVGKSTLLKLLAGLMEPSAGQVTAQGAAEWGDELVTLVQQVPFLFYGTILENLQLVRPGLTHEDIIAIARRYGIYQVFDALPRKLLTAVGENGKSISGGEKQLISVLRGLLIDPPILLLDEITSNLSPRIAQELTTNIYRHRAGRITIIVAHQPLSDTPVDVHLDLDALLAGQSKEPALLSLTHV